MWWLQTKNPKNPIDPIAYNIPISPNIGFLLYVETIWDITPKPGIIKMYTSGCLNNIYINPHVTRGDIVNVVYIIQWTIS